MLRLIFPSKYESMRIKTPIKRYFSSQIDSKNISNDDVNRFDKESWESAKSFSELPGPKGLPILGNTWRFLPLVGEYYGNTFGEMFNALRNKYGDIVKLENIFSQNTIIYLFNPNDVEKVYKIESTFPSRDVFPTLTYYRYNKRQEIFKDARGLVTSNGQEWYDFRSKVNPVMMRPNTIKQYFNPVDEITNELVDRIKTLRQENNKIDCNFMKEINKWSLENIVAIALDTRLNCLVDDLSLDSIPSKLIQAADDIITLSYKLDFRPSIWRYYATPNFKKLMKALDDQVVISSKFIDKAIERINNNKNIVKDNNVEPSILEKLLTIDKKVAVVMAVDMMIAGIDTTSTTLVNALYYLATNKDKQDILRSEIKSVLSDKETKLTIDHLGKIPYARACLKEASRLYPIGPGGMRSLSHDTVLSGYRVPKGTMTFFPHMILSIQESEYPEPDKFIPERWLRNMQDSYLSYKNAHPFASLPFGFGARSCIGRRIAELELDIAIIQFIRNFDLGWNGPPPERGTTMLNVLREPFNFEFKNID